MIGETPEWMLWVLVGLLTVIMCLPGLKSLLRPEESRSKHNARRLPRPSGGSSICGRSGRGLSQRHAIRVPEKPLGEGGNT